MRQRAATSETALVIHHQTEISDYLEAQYGYRRDGQKTAQQARAWGGQAGEVYDPCYHRACDRLDNVNRDVLDHYLRAVAGTVARFATSTVRLR